VFLLHTAAEVEHALLAQYLYGAWSLPGRDLAAVPPPQEHPWRTAIIKVARQEMGHLVTVQNILRSLRAPLNLEREDYPFRSDLYPFDFRLERLSLHSLAKYVLAEMPKDPPISTEKLNELRETAGAGPGTTPVNRVGDLYDRLIALAEDHLRDANFSPATVPLQAQPDAWRADASNQVIVQTVANKADALLALRLIADQGEGSQMPSPGEESHFDIFLRLYEERKAAAADPSAPVPQNPNTSPAPQPGTVPDENEPTLTPGRILHLRARKWALLFNLRYRILLTSIAHALSLPTDENGPEGRVRNWAFFEMFLLSRLSDVLTRLPQEAESAAARAGAPFEMPYSLTLPDDELGRWLLHRDLVDGSRTLVSEMESSGAAVLPPEQHALAGLREEDAARLSEIEARIAALRPPGEGEITTIKELRLLPALACARFGSSSDPMDNYELGAPDSTGWRPLVARETLVVNPDSGEITTATVPTEVRFRDVNGLIRPVCPFIEVWARFIENGDLQALTLHHLQQLGLDASALRWQVRAGNLKAFRRTGAANDRVQADTGPFSDHALRPILGRASNFKPGKAIALGSVRFIKPNAQFPELRLRFTPAPGHVFGTVRGDPNIVDDVYDAARGAWDGHVDGAPGTPSPTAPAQIFAGVDQNDQWTSLGYFDDACDAIVSLDLSIPASSAPLTAAARVSSGPPHFAPDSLPIRTVADELEQMLLGPEVPTPTEPQAIMELGIQAKEIILRALETARLLNSAAMNTGGMAAHDTGWRRAREPIFPPATAAYPEVIARHSEVVSALNGVTAPAGSPERAAAAGALSLMANILRRFDQVGDLTNEGRRRMPAMMRGADGLHLAVTRRQLDTVLKAAAALAAVPEPMTPQQQMVHLITFFRVNANRHTPIDTGGGQTLDQLFRDPPSVLDYLMRGVVQGDLAPEALRGRPLIVPGDGDASAFLQLIQTPGHPMNLPFAQSVPSVGKTGVQIVREWIASLPTDRLAISSTNQTPASPHG
jgi:hypothetical protein